MLLQCSFTRVSFISYEKSILDVNPFSTLARLTRLTKYCGKLNNLLSPKNISSNQSLVTHFHEIFAKNCVKENSSHYGNLLSHFFDKNFKKTMFLWIKVLNSWFDEKKNQFSTLRSCNFHTCLARLNRHFIKLFVIKFYRKKLISRNFWDKNVAQNIIIFTLCAFHNSAYCCILLISNFTEAINQYLLSIHLKFCANFLLLF